MSEKVQLLSDMKSNPMKYRREEMFHLISNGVLTEQDLVSNFNILTERAYSHILHYPSLLDEQRELPISELLYPQSEEGNIDVYFFGVSGVGKSCVLAGLMAQSGRLGFSFDPRGSGGGGIYAMELRNYARTSRLPPAKDQEYIQLIDCDFFYPERRYLDDNGWFDVVEKQRCQKFSFIEMSGIKLADISKKKGHLSLNDLGIGATQLLSNDNNKVIFFVIDTTNEKKIEFSDGSNHWVMQSDILNCVSSLLSKDRSLMKKVEAIHVILTKSDTLGDCINRDVILEALNSQGYRAVIEDINGICEQYNINRTTGFHVGLYPFSIGKFMPGDVYVFDDTDSEKILRAIRGVNLRPKPNINNSKWSKFKQNLYYYMSEWFNK